MLDEPLTGLDPRQRAAHDRAVPAPRRRGPLRHRLEPRARRGRALRLAACSSSPQGRLAAEGDFRAIRDLMDDRPHRIRVRTTTAAALAGGLLARGRRRRRARSTATTALDRRHASTRAASRARSRRSPATRGARLSRSAARRRPRERLPLPGGRPMSTAVAARPSRWPLPPDAAHLVTRGRPRRPAGPRRGRRRSWGGPRLERALASSAASAWSTATLVAGTRFVDSFGLLAAGAGDHARVRRRRRSATPTRTARSSTCGCDRCSAGTHRRRRRRRLVHRGWPLVVGPARHRRPPPPGRHRPGGRHGRVGHRRPRRLHRHLHARSASCERALVWGLLYIFIWEGFVAGRRLRRPPAPCAPTPGRSSRASPAYPCGGPRSRSPARWLVPVVVGTLALAFASWRLAPARHRLTVAVRPQAAVGRGGARARARWANQRSDGILGRGAPRGSPSAAPGRR